MTFEQLKAPKAPVSEFSLESYSRKLSAALEVQDATPEARAIVVELMLNAAAFLAQPVTIQRLVDTPIETVPVPPPLCEPTLAELAEVSAEYAAYYAEIPEVAALYLGLSHAAWAIDLRDFPHKRLFQAAATVQCRLRNVLQEQGLTLGYEVQRNMHQVLSGLARTYHYFLYDMRLDSQPKPDAANRACMYLSRLQTLPEQKKKKGKQVTVQRQPSVDVPRVREALEGKQILIIGSDVANQPFLQSCQALGLNVRWQTYMHGQSVYDLEAAIRQSEVRVVVCAIRWTAHAVGDAKGICKAYDRLFVNLPAGYNPNVLCYHIMSQVGDRLLAESKAA